jgi:two-component system OmpR family sensor kinase
MLEAPRRWSLRRRLVLATSVVLVVVLAVADLATYAALRSFLFNRVDDSLTTADRALDSVLFKPDSDEPAVSDEAFAAVVPGAYAEERDANGKVVLSGSAQRDFAKDTPKLPKTISGLTASGSRRYFTVASKRAGGTEFRVRAQRQTNGAMLIVALPLDDVASTLRHLLLIEFIVSGAALAAAIALGIWLVHVSLRPLRTIEETAEHIAKGHLGARVPEDDVTEVGRLGGSLNAMLERIESAFHRRMEIEERLRSFVADASHELRTPVAAVAAYAELFERGARDRPADLERAMHGIRVESARLQTLIDELLLLARLDESGLRRREPVDLVALAGEAVASAALLGPEWPVRMAAPAPVEVEGDPIALRQIIDNLLTNVRTHTPPGTAVQVRIEPAGELVVLEVRDNGPGMTSEMAGRAFERFFRGDPSRSRARGGTGLGLAVVQALVSAHGGTIELFTKPGEGARFLITLPRSTA